MGNSLVATKIQGKYWMYWGEGPIFGAVSDDLVVWEPILNKEGNPLPVLDKRANKDEIADLVIIIRRFVPSMKNTTSYDM